MTKDCSITISGSENDSVIRAEGRCHSKDGRYYVFFEHENTKCSLKFDEFSVEYARHGDMDVILTLRQGEKTYTDYATPYGSLRAGFETRSYCFTETDERIHIEIDYELELDASGNTRNIMKIDIDRKTGGYDEGT